MYTCVVETGLFKKKTCGQNAVTRCANCEISLCAQHAVPQLANGKKTGKFMCKECDAAQKEHDKNLAAAPKVAHAKPAAAGAPAGGAKPAAHAAAPAAKPGAPATPAAKPPENKPDDDAPLEFTPTKK
jgi:hypothetical protein